MIRLARGLALASACLYLAVPAARAGNDGDITVRTERYPRPPYSGAEYYIYERNGAIICTKLKVCNKYDQCETVYKKGAYKDPEDIGEPYGTTPAVMVPASKQAAHVCLTRFKLNAR